MFLIGSFLFGFFFHREHYVHCTMYSNKNSFKWKVSRCRGSKDKKIIFYTEYKKDLFCPTLLYYCMYSCEHYVYSKQLETRWRKHIFWGVYCNIMPIAHVSKKYLKNLVHCTNNAFLWKFISSQVRSFHLIILILYIYCICFSLFVNFMYLFLYICISSYMCFFRYAFH